MQITLIEHLLCSKLGLWVENQAGSLGNLCILKLGQLEYPRNTVFLPLGTIKRSLEGKGRKQNRNNRTNMNFHYH